VTSCTSACSSYIIEAAMPFRRSLSVLCCLVFVHSAHTVAVTDVAQRGSTSLSPVTRVVQLLKDLLEKTEQEHKAEEDLYETFVCWATSIIGQKEASNAAANSRLETLKTYLADLEAGRIELTSERADLTKEIETLNADMELAQDMRKKENEDFEEAKDEMEKAIKALTAAIEVLKDATKDHKTGVLLKMSDRFSVMGGSRTAEAAVLTHATKLGDRFLSRGDAVFLHRLLTGEVPTWDWKKLNRPATFKKSYKARSFKIQDILAKLLETFTTNLQDATAKEKESQATFDKLMDSKGAELSAAEEALEKMEKENGARGMSKAETKEEIGMLTSQVEADTKYIKQVQDALADKKEEWKWRQELRMKEQEAISKAISILHSDDSRDLFKKSFASQGYFFLQVQEQSQKRGKQRGAFQALHAASMVSGDTRLGVLASRLAAGGHFDEVIEEIDKMVVMLKDEAAEDLKHKETCESDRAEDTRDAIKFSRTMDENTELIRTLKSEIEEILKDIDEKEKEVKEMQDQIAELTKIREDENREYLSAKADDEAASELVAQAQDVLETFYKENNLMLAQKTAKQPFTAAAGEAPPPPPTTWEGGYTGKTDESTGIVAILGMIKEDIDKDLEKATNSEKEAVALFDETVKELNSNIENAEKLVISLKITQGEKEKSVEDTKDARSKTAGELEAVMEKIKNAESGCDFFTINFPLRAKDRQIEIDGLLKAKAILQGAKFDEGPDPSREIKPGDAFVQMHLRR